MDRYELFTALHEIVKSHNAKKSDIEEKIKRIELQIASGRYSFDGIKELREERGKLLFDLRVISETSERDLRNAIKKWNAENVKGDTLDGAELDKDTIALLNCGVKISGADLNALFDKHAGNNTMQQIIAKYAKEHGVKDFTRVYISAGVRAERNERTVMSACGLCMKFPHRAAEIIDTLKESMFDDSFPAADDGDE